jgi:hypothetical protein
MELIKDRPESRGKKKWHLEGGRIYFSRTAERRFFFSLTVVMLLLGVLFKLGVLQ